ncbi:unnamed protein product, partial [Clonostachys chloroleuca]
MLFSLVTMYYAGELQIGMFSIPVLSPGQVLDLRENNHAFRADIIQRMYLATFAQLIPIYDAQMTLVTEHNVDHVVQSSHKVIIGVFVLVILLKVIP